MEACSKALAVLSSDEVCDLFIKTFNPAFVQASENREHQTAPAEGSDVEDRQLRLAAVAKKVKLDAFMRVKKAIDDMIAQLGVGRELGVLEVSPS